MTAEHSSEEGGEGLSEAERKTLNGPLVSMLVRNDGVSPTLYAAVERILADRLAAVQADRDHWIEQADDRLVERVETLARAESAETALATARREVEEMRAERDPLRGTLRIGTELDNHHNADACPYCTGGLRAERDDLRGRLAAARAHTITLHEKITGLVWSCACGAIGAGARERVKAAADDHLRAALANPSAAQGEGEA